MAIQTYETEEKWVSDNVRNGLVFAGLTIFIVTLISWALFPFHFPDTKKTEHKVINTSLFILTIISGVGNILIGRIVAHDEPIFIMERERRRNNKVYEIGVGEQIQQDQIMSAILPALPSAEPDDFDSSYDVQQTQPTESDYGHEPTTIPVDRNPIQDSYRPIQQRSNTAVIEPEVLPTRPTTNIRQIDKIIEDLALCRTSILLCSVPGSGKTTVTLAWLYLTLTLTPGAEFYIIGQKRDNWLGLGNIPGVLTVVSTDVTEMMEKIEKVVKILEERCEIPEEERKFSDIPVRLILDDFTATFSNLRAYPKKVLDSFKSFISKIVTVGREFNVCIYVSAHSFNLENLGLDGKDIRDCLKLMCLGLETLTERNEKQGGYESIETILKNPNIIKEGDKMRLTKEYKELKPVSLRNTKQLLFCTLGTVKIRLLSDLRWVKNERFELSSNGTYQKLQPQNRQYSNENNIAVDENEDSLLQFNKPMVGISNQLSPINDKNQGESTRERKKIELNKLDSSSQSLTGEITDISTWLKVPFPNGLNLIPPYRPGLYAMLIENQAVYVGQTTNLYQRMNVDKHKKKPKMYEAHQKGLKTEIAYFSTNISDEKRKDAEDYLINKYKAPWNGVAVSDNNLPETPEEFIKRMDSNIYKFCLEQYKQSGEGIRVREIQRTKLKNEFNLDSNKIKESFKRLEDKKRGWIDIESNGSLSESWKFVPEINVDDF